MKLAPNHGQTVLGSATRSSPRLAHHRLKVLRLKVLRTTRRSDRPLSAPFEARSEARLGGSVETALDRLRTLSRHRPQLAAPSAIATPPVAPPVAAQLDAPEADADSRRDDFAFAALGLLFLALVMI